MSNVKYMTRKVRSRRRRARKLFVFAFPLILAFLTVGYHYRDTLYAYWENGSKSENGNIEEPATGNKPGNTPGQQPPSEEKPVDEHSSLYPPPEGEILYLADGNYLLALVTKQTSLGEYEPSDLKVIPSELMAWDQRQWSYYLREEALSQLTKMVAAAYEQGIVLQLNSAYRSYETQNDLFNNYARRHGEEGANRFSARPGQSEHQLGTAVDFGRSSSVYLNAEMLESIWLVENAHKYGFALSYPEGSTEITGYTYEPWHYRYIGVEAAAAWKASGKVLIEFLQEQPQYWLE